jgi:large subunit ribosomal protein L13
MLKSANTKTTRGSKNGFQRPYYLLDASTLPIGRIATEAARVLIGKNRADFSPDVDMGGMVVIINANKQFMSGQKMSRKVYFRYGRQLGSLKSRSYAEQVELDFKFPLYTAIKKMLPRNRHQDLRINNRVFIFEDENHNITFPLFDSYTSQPVTNGNKAIKPEAPKFETKVDISDMKPEVEAPVTANFADTSVKADSQASSTTDDLTIIEGIGPKINELLHSAGITTFAQVANASIEELTRILNEGGSSFNSKIGTIPSWAEQSSLARYGKMEELEILKEKLNNGK